MNSMPADGVEKSDKFTPSIAINWKKTQTYLGENKSFLQTVIIALL